MVTSALRKPVCESTWISVRVLQPYAPSQLHVLPLARTMSSLGTASMLVIMRCVSGALRCTFSESAPCSRLYLSMSSWHRLVANFMGGGVTPRAMCSARTPRKTASALCGIGGLGLP